MTRYNSLEVSAKLFCNETWDVLWNNRFLSYITIAFTAPVAFLCCINDRDGYSHGLMSLILFHGRSIFWKTLLFSLPSLLDFWRSCSYWVLAWLGTVMLTSLSKLYTRLMTSCFVVYHDSSSLAYRNSYCVHHNVSNSLLPLTVFWDESCLKLCYPLK